MIYATQNQNIFENFYSFPVWTIEENHLSCAKHLTMRQITDKSIYLWVLKWLPVIGTALIASHYAMLPFGYKSFIIDYITDVSLFAWIYLYFASKLFFCKLHRAFCIYIGVASLDIDLHNWFELDFLEPQWLIPLIMITTAVVLITLAWRKKIQCYG